MATESELAGWIALGQVPGLGDAGIRKLLAQFGLPERIFGTPAGELARVVDDAVARSIASGPRDEVVAPALDWLSRPGNHLVTLDHPDYPPRLLQIPDPPPILYVKGDPRALQRPALAMVGSRNATAQGVATAEAFARALSDSGLAIVSGLAPGIDAAAHRGGMAGRSGSIAVLGTGLDLVYPARHRDLAHDLTVQGALVSELPLGTAARPQNFPRRNRIISGLSLGCLVVEAALQSGSLITARLAMEQGREVFAIPGSIHSPLTKGCHRLIQQGAKLVEQAQDVLDELAWPHAIEPAEPAPGEHGGEALSLLACLGPEPRPVDVLSAESGLTASRVSSILLQLELQGMVASLPGGRYQRIFHNH